MNSSTYFAIVVAVLVAVVFGVYGRENAKDAALTECNTLGGTLIISADERYICVADAVEVGK